MMMMMFEMNMMMMVMVIEMNMMMMMMEMMMEMMMMMMTSAKQVGRTERGKKESDRQGS